METKQIRITQVTVDELREIGKTLGAQTDDVTIKLLIAGYKQLNTENELLKMKLEDCRKEKYK
jgi:ribosomal protein L12E/L44/L45/RPP1/RPP2